MRATVAGSPPQQVLVRWIDDMGQQLFAPPNVKGWRGGKAWLSTSAVLARHNFAQALAMGSLWRGYRPAGLNATAVEAELDAL